MKKYVPFFVMIFIIAVISIGVVGCSSSKTTQANSPQNTTTNTTTSTTVSTSVVTPGLTALTVNINTKSGIGSYLVDGKGMTLYWTELDAVGQSNVTGSTLALWPVFYNANMVVPSSLNASDFGFITRTDGSKQTTYKGFPIYYYV